VERIPRQSPLEYIACRVWNLGSMFWDPWFRVHSLEMLDCGKGFTVSLGFRIQGNRARVGGVFGFSGFRVFGFSGFRVFGFWVLGFGFWVLGFGFWVLGFGFWVLGFGFKV